MRKILVLFLPLILLACVSETTPPVPPPTPTVTPEPTPTATPIIFPTPLPTPTPVDFGALFAALADMIPTPAPAMVNPPPTPEIVDVTPTPTFAATPPPATPAAPTPVPSPTVLPTPRPTATPQVGYYAPTPPAPVIEGWESLFDDAEFEVQWAGRVLRTVTISGRVERPARSTTAPEPTMVQVWQALYSDGKPDCNTERPIAFILPEDGESPPELKPTPHRWRFCRKDSNGTIIQDGINVSEVPWFHASEWSWEPRKRRLTTDPHIWDFSMTADFASDESMDLEYRNPKGWRIVVYRGDKIIGYWWVSI